jgi:hypothetical protein
MKLIGLIQGWKTYATAAGFLGYALYQAVNLKDFHSAGLSVAGAFAALGLSSIFAPK